MTHKLSARSKQILEAYDYAGPIRFVGGPHHNRHFHLEKWTRFVDPEGGRCFDLLPEPGEKSIYRLEHIHENHGRALVCWFEYHWRTERSPIIPGFTYLVRPNLGPLSPSTSSAHPKLSDGV